MSPYSSPSSSPPPSPSRRRLKSCARRCERACCALATYFPLAFVYSLTTWAVWVEASIGLGRTHAKHLTTSIKASSLLGVCLYLLLNTCYTVAVFVDPGSPDDMNNPTKSSSRRNGKYSILPTTEPDLDPNGSAAHPSHSTHSSVQNITVSSRGGSRFCKKCHSPKPDRTHHCSTCKRCVLKMDHHCPWLATCLGLHNYKPFILFLIYTSIFCWVCLGSSAYWMWDNLLSSNQYLEEYAPINIIMLTVISGIIGLVLTGFTAWHLYLCLRGQTTIECLEKTRYLSGVRSRVERNRIESMHPQHNHTQSNDFADRVRRAGDQILEFHANAVPGASRYEEGEEHSSPTPSRRQHLSPDQNDQYHDHPHAYDDSTTEHSSIDTPAVRALRRSYNQHAPQPQSQHQFHQPQPLHHQSQSSYEHDRETSRYEEYLDDRDSEKLPNAFDLGWKRNLAHLFGRNPWLWALPVCNTTGDGWRWDVSERWVQAREEAEGWKRGREFGNLRGGHAAYPQSMAFGGDAAYDERHGTYPATHAHAYDTRHPGIRNPNEREVYPHSPVSMQTLDSRGVPRGPAASAGRDDTGSGYSHADPSAMLHGTSRDRVWGGRYKRDVDRSGEDGVEEAFEVSEDEDVHEERSLREGGGALVLNGRLGSRKEGEGEAERERQKGREGNGEGGWERDWD